MLLWDDLITACPSVSQARTLTASAQTGKLRPKEGWGGGLPTMGRADHPSPAVRFLPTRVNWPDGQTFIQLTMAGPRQLPALVLGHRQLALGMGVGKNTGPRTFCVWPNRNDKEAVLPYPVQPSTSEVGEGLRARGVDSCRRPPSRGQAHGRGCGGCGGMGRESLRGSSGRAGGTQV